MGWVKRIIGETSENRIMGQKKSIIHQGLLIDQALESGSLKQRNVVAVLTGITGSGKTWLLNRLFDRLPPCRSLQQHGTR